MKKLFLLPLLLLLLIPSAFPVYSATHDDGIYSMAQYFPADTLIFATSRIDEAFIQDIDDFYVDLSSGVSELGIPSMPLTQMLQGMTGINPDEILSWLGDYVAVGAYATGQFTSTYYAVILLDDPTAVDAYMSDTFSFLERQEVDETIIYSDTFFTAEIDDTLLKLYLEPLPEIGDITLLDTQHYSQSVNALPLDEYQIGLYFAAEQLFSDQVPEEQLEIVNPNLGGVAVGMTGVDASTLVADVVHTPLEFTEYDGSGRVNPEFLSNIPDSMTSVMVASDLSHVITAALEEAYAVDERSGGMLQMPDVNEEIFSQVGIDLEADVLSLLTGEYAMFADIELVPIVKDALAYEVNVDGRIHGGVMADASADPEAAQRLVNQLSELMQSAPEDPSVSFRTETIAGTDVTVISTSTEITNPLVEYECNIPPSTTQLNFEFVLGASDEYFVFASRPLADTILSGDYEGVETTAGYQQAEQYFLPDPTSIWYADGEGFVHSVVFNPVSFLFVASPQIGCVFENIVMELDGTPVATPTATPTPAPTATPDFQQIDAQVAPVEYIQNLISSASITSTVTDEGVIMARFAITYNP